MPGQMDPAEVERLRSLAEGDRSRAEHARALAEEMAATPPPGPDDVAAALGKLRQGVSHNMHTPLPVSAPQLAREWYRGMCDRAADAGKRAPTWVALHPVDHARFVDDARQWLDAYNACAKRNQERAGS